MVICIYRTHSYCILPQDISGNQLAIFAPSATEGIVASALLPFDMGSSQL